MADIAATDARIPWIVATSLVNMATHEDNMAGAVLRAQCMLERAARREAASGEASDVVERFREAYHHDPASPFSRTLANVLAKAGMRGFEEVTGGV